MVFNCSLQVIRAIANRRRECRLGETQQIASINGYNEAPPSQTLLLGR